MCTCCNSFSSFFPSFFISLELLLFSLPSSSLSFCRVFCLPQSRHFPQPHRFPPQGALPGPSLRFLLLLSSLLAVILFLGFQGRPEKPNFLFAPFSLVRKELMNPPGALGAAWLPLSPLEVSPPQLWEGLAPLVSPWEEFGSSTCRFLEVP